MNTEIYNKNGELTKYGLCLGYVEKRKSDNQWKELYIEHNTIHVRSGFIGSQFENWESFQVNELTKARNYFNFLSID